MAIRPGNGEGGRTAAAAMIALTIALLCAQSGGLSLNDGVDQLASEEPAEDSLLAMSEEAEEKEQLYNNPTPASVKNPSAPEENRYSYKITPGFAIQEQLVKNTDTDVKGLTACKRACGLNAKCKAFSYRSKNGAEGDKCYIATKGLTYHWGWELNVRGVKINAQGVETSSARFHSFPGMLMDGFETIQDVTREDCRGKCDDMSISGEDTDGEEVGKCNSFSYNNDAQKCYMSASKIKYDPDYEYYENKQRTLRDPDERPEHTRQRRIQEKREQERATSEKRKRVAKERAENGEKFQAAMMKNRELNIQQEVREKKSARDESQAKIDARHLQLQASIKTANEQGIYQETVEKSLVHVRQSEFKVKKERKAKRDFSQRSILKADKAKRVKTKRVEASLKKMKTMSYLSVSLGDAKEERHHLRVRQRALEVYSKAQLLATEQRLATGRAMPGERERLAVEDKYKKQLAAVKNALSLVKIELRKTAADMESRKVETVDQAETNVELLKVELQKFKGKEAIRLKKGLAKAKASREGADVLALEKRRKKEEPTPRESN